MDIFSIQSFLNKPADERTKLDYINVINWFINSNPFFNKLTNPNREDVATFLLNNDNLKIFDSNWYFNYHSYSLFGGDRNVIIVKNKALNQFELYLKRSRLGNYNKLSTKIAISTLMELYNSIVAIEYVPQLFYRMIKEYIDIIKNGRNFVYVGGACNWVDETSKFEAFRRIDNVTFNPNNLSLTIYYKSFNVSTLTGDGNFNESKQVTYYERDKIKRELMCIAQDSNYDNIHKYGEIMIGCYASLENKGEVIARFHQLINEILPSKPKYT